MPQMVETVFVLKPIWLEHMAVTDRLLLAVTKRKGSPPRCHCGQTLHSTGEQGCTDRASGKHRRTQLLRRGEGGRWGWWVRTGGRGCNRLDASLWECVYCHRNMLGFSLKAEKKSRYKGVLTKTTAHILTAMTIYGKKKRKMVCDDAATSFSICKH